MNEKAWKKEIGINMCLDKCVEELTHIGLSKTKIKYCLVERALDVCPPKPKPIIISGKMVNEAIKQFIVKEKEKECEQKQ